MWIIGNIRQLGKDNKGSFTVEIVFVMLIIVGVILSILYVSLSCLDHMNIESQLREGIREGVTTDEINSLFGSTSNTKKETVGLWCEQYRISYQGMSQILLIKPFIPDSYIEYVEDAKVCSQDTCEFVRMYDALRNKE